MLEYRRDRVFYELRLILRVVCAFALLGSMSLHSQPAPDSAPKPTRAKSGKKTMKSGTKTKATLSPAPPASSAAEAPPIGGAPPVPQGPHVGPEKPDPAATKAGEAPSKHRATDKKP
jgi:hypothetical protein